MLMMWGLICCFEKGVDRQVVSCMKTKVETTKEFREVALLLLVNGGSLPLDTSLTLSSHP